MGAGAAQRGSRVIRRQLEDEQNRVVQVRASHLSDLASRASLAEDQAGAYKMEFENTARELARAKNLIARLRAENTTLKQERKEMIEVVQATKRHPMCAKRLVKYGVALVGAKLRNARLL